MAVNLEDVVKLAEQLDSDQQNLLIYRLRVKQMRERKIRETVVEARQVSSESPTRNELLQELAILRQKPVDIEDSLLGKYANSNVSDMTEEEFHAQMHSIATEWEQELDEFNDDKS